MGKGRIAIPTTDKVVAISTSTPEDVKTLVVPVLAHRLILTAEAELAGRSGEELVASLAAQVDVPNTPSLR